MSVQVENLEKNMAKLTIEASAQELEQAIQAAYLKERSKISIPGFRKGKVPRAMIEKMYGPGIFFEAAANQLISQEYLKALNESGIEVVSKPDIDITQMEKGKPFIFTAEVAVKPQVTLGEYKGVQVTKIDTAVTEEEVDAAVEKERESNARIVAVEDRSVEDGDFVLIDYEGFSDGVPFEGGKGENHSLKIGSHAFIDTFEEQLIGKNAGDEVDVHVTFPEKYHAQDLAGKPAVFKVKIHEIKTNELPELDDEFAQDVSEFDTIAEYKQNVKEKLEEKKKVEAKHTQEDEAIQKIIDSCGMEIPDAMLNTQVDTMINEFAHKISQQGLSIEQYMQFTSITMEQMQEQMRPEAMQRIQAGLVLEAIANQEQIQVSEEDVDVEIDKMAEMYGMEPAEAKRLINQTEREKMKKDIAIQKAVEIIMEHVEEKEADPE